MVAHARSPSCGSQTANSRIGPRFSPDVRNNCEITTKACNENGLRVVHVVAFTNFHAVVTQDVVGRHEMEIEVWQGEADQVIHAVEGTLLPPHFERNLFPF